jgi:tRNA(Ile)-lysidine synthase
MESESGRSEKKIEKKVLRIVRQTIAEHRMLAVGDAVLIAVSGGQDSVTLAHVLHSIAEEYRLRPAIAHLNHCLRENESDRDAEFVADFARQLGMPSYIESRDVRRFQQSARLSLEEAARRIRYEFLEELAARNGFNKIAVGHHSNDNAELILMNLLRGTGTLGLSGILPVRDNLIIRPLLELNRSIITDYVAEKQLPYVTDRSNSDLSIRRNRIRRHLIPELQESYNPAIIETLNRLGNIMRAEDQWLENLLSEDLERCISMKGRQAVNLDLRQFEGLATAARRRILRQAILMVKKDLRRITLLHIDAVLLLIDKKQGAGLLNLPDGIRVLLKDGSLIIDKNTGDIWADSYPDGEPVVIDYHYTVSAPVDLFIKEAGATLKLSEIGVDEITDINNSGGNMAFFDMDRLQRTLTVRNVRPGDRFSPLGVNGTQKVKKYFIDHKIPAPQRRLCPLLLSGTHIVWITGYRTSNCAKVVSTTQRILKAELLLA